MAIKTISLELDAYEKLKRAKRGKESFSAVVRRARFNALPSTGSSILEETAALYDTGKGASSRALKYFTNAEVEEMEHPRISDSPWDDPV